MALVAYDASDESGNENESIFSSLPTPKVQTTFAENPVEAPVTNTASSKYQPGEKKRAKITVPSLSEFKEEDSEPSQKKAKQFKSGLFAVLPPPQNSSLKEGNRSFIPYTLTKRQTPVVSKPGVNSKPLAATKQTIRKPSSSASRATRDSEDEDDEEPVDFFSLSDAAANSLPEVAAVPLPPIDTEIFNMKQELPQDVVVNLPSNIYANPPPVPGVTAHPTVSDDREQHLEDVANEENQIVGDDVQGEPSSWVPMNDADILQDEGFLRLQGKRPKGGKMKDDITIIDVSQDDQLPSASERQSKALTQETEYRPRRKGGAPTSQQRRKHQITYLAFQAREREYELKNQWAENRMTRKQTQSKYGF